MPELVDLPPELIEHIFIDVEDLVYDELLGTDRESDAVAPLFRLVNRYVEQCTCREFAISYFDIHYIKAPDDASIEKFCAIAQVPDLAKCVIKLVFCVDDDISMHKQRAAPAPQDVINSSEVRDTHSTVGAPPPLAYLRNKNAVIDALRACSNTEELTFEDKWPEPDVINSRKTQVAVTPHRSWEDEQMFDMSTSFNYILSLAEKAGVRPLQLSTSTHIVGTAQDEPWCGLTDCTVMTKAGSALHGLEELDLRISREREELGLSPGDVGRRFGRQLQEGLANMPVLRSLHLSSRLGTSASRAMWAALAKVPSISTLDHLDFGIIDCDLNDYTSFILKYSETLRTLLTNRVGFHGGTFIDLSMFYAGLSKAPRLEDFCQYGLGFEGKDPVHYVRLPRHLCFPEVEFDEDEDGFIKVDVYDFIVRWKGRDGVKHVLAELAVHFANG